MTTFTKAEKNVYFKGLRKQWQESKELADNDEAGKALFREAGGEFSYYSFYFTLLQMKDLGYSCVPYVDGKTFNKWREAGFRVRKGEKSRIKGIAWIMPKAKDEEDEVETGYKYPKVYRLFHETQVDPIEA